ncbi:MAG: dihydropteroate synthase [Firmicutes bacterium]|nr:dihydropteroate synthase [Bacillota bacterium]
MQKSFDLLKEKILVLDGAMGTMLQSCGLKPGECPERWNIDHPEVVQRIHRLYVAAGADIIQTNTFGGNRFKLREFGLGNQVAEINKAAVRLAKQAAGDRALVAVSIGPTGQLIEPFGETTFDEVYAAFREQVTAAVQAGADLISLETMSDLQEIRAAMLAARDSGPVPVICQMTFEGGQRTMLGTDPVTAAVVLTTLGASAVGANCSGGPAELLKVITAMAMVTDLPLVVQPNAGLPVLIDGQTVYPESPATMAEYAVKLVDAGANIVGGCCGTNPDHIRAISQAVRGRRPVKRVVPPVSALTGRSQTLFIQEQGRPIFIGERINPTARKKLAEDIRAGRMLHVVEEAQAQVAAGAPMLDVNVGVPGVDEVAAMRKAVLQIQSTVDVPLALDSTNPEAIEAGLKVFAGKPLINSVNGEAKSLQAILPLARRYGAAVLGLTLDSHGIPSTAEGRLAIARRIVDAALAYGIRREDIYIDCLVQTVSAQQAEVMETLRAIQLVKRELGVKTILGVSNVSHGLPRREVLNSTFLAMACGFGLDLPIMNPFDQRMREGLWAVAVLTGRDPYARGYIDEFRPALNEAPITTSEAAKPSSDRQQRIYQAVLNGEKASIAALVKAALEEGVDPLVLVNQTLIPAIEEVGERYDKKIFFLPQLMLAGETMKAAFEVVKPRLATEQAQNLGTIVLATVQGDIHDIGKNIVAVMLENYGWRVVDLGRDVPTATIVEAAVREQATIVGLSALMTTTMPRMAEVITAMRARGVKTKVMVGGAVVTADYAAKIGADGYAADARAAVLKAKELLG